MSYLSRTLKKQHRILKSLESTPLIILSGLGLKKIIVFPERKDSPETVMFYSGILQKEIASGKYEDIQKFDAIHTADIDFSCFYRGKFIKKYHNMTKQQLLNLGCKWRTRIAEEHPDAQVWIVVHHDDEDGWFLDTFNWDVSKKWDTKLEFSIWL
jgi:hypothetical protein